MKYTWYGQGEDDPVIFFWIASWLMLTTISSNNIFLLIPVSPIIQRLAYYNREDLVDRAVKVMIIPYHKFINV